MKRMCLAFAVLCFLCFGFVDYSRRADDWFAEKVNLTIGLPFSPWFEYGRFKNPIEGGERLKLHLWSWSLVPLVVGFVFLWRYRRARTAGHERDDQAASQDADVRDP